MGLIFFSEIYKKYLHSAGSRTPSKHATHYGPLYGFRYYKLTMPSPIKRIPSIEHMGCDDQFCSFEPWESSPVLMWKTFVWLHHITNGGRFGSIKQDYSLQVPVPSQESGRSYTMYMCVTGNRKKKTKHMVINKLLGFKHDCTMGFFLSYSSVTSFTTCCTSTVWQQDWSQMFADNIE
jgi:hypothetical protein